MYLQDAHDGTPLASQSSQPGVALKRKILDNGPEDNPAKKPSQQESGLLDEDNSILGLSELPSQLGSPSIEPLARPKVASRRKVSTSTFSQVIQSQESQTKKIDETKSLDDESFPSALGSPDAVISQRPGKKSRISISTFSKTIEARKVMEKSVTKSSTATEDLSHESTDIPISLESPVINYRPGPKSSKKRVSSTSFQDTLQDKRSNASNSAQPSSAEHVSVNTTVPDTLDSPTNMPTDRRLLNKQRKKISLTAFSQVIEKRTDSVPVKPTRTSESGSSYSSTPKNQTSDQYISEDDSPEIKEIESPQEIYSSREPSVHVTEFQSQQAPTTTKVVEETVVGNRSSPNDVEDFEHYLSLSDDDINNQPNSKNKIAEFTALQVQQPSAQERRSPTGNTDPKGSRSTRSNSKIAVMEEVFGASDDDELKFTADTSIAFKRTYSHPKDKTATMETLENLVGIPDIGSPEDFAPTASSTQLVKRKPPAPVDQTVMEELLSENQRSIPKKKLSQTPAKTDRPEKDDGMSTSDIPSKLNSPEEVKRDRHRPGPASSKKRVSMTQFMAALDQRSVVPPQFETPQKPSSAPQTTPVLVSEVVLQPPIESVTESLQVSKVLPRRSLRASTSSSTTVPRQDPGLSIFHKRFLLLISV